MAKKPKRITSHTDRPSPHRIRADEKKDVLDGLVLFSFKFYEPGHPRYHCRGRSPDYFIALLQRLKDLSNARLSEFTHGATHRATRFHPIDFKETRVGAPGFGIRQWEDVDDDAWQFSVSANEHGRVHGFLVGFVFYIVWLDPDHRLYA